MLKTTHTNQTPSLVGDGDGGDNFRHYATQNHTQ